MFDQDYGTLFGWTILATAMIMALGWLFLCLWRVWRRSKQEQRAPLN